jgi:predicted helicase
MTATPRLYTPSLRREAGQIDVEVASMDDEAVFGRVLHRLSFGEAIERDLLSDYQVVVVGADDETYRTYAERGEFVTRDGERITDARTLADEAVVGGIASLRVLAGEAEQIDQLLPEVLEFALTPYLGTAEARRIISAG